MFYGLQLSQMLRDSKIQHGPDEPAATDGWLTGRTDDDYPMKAT